MDKIDRRIHYYLMLDTETANSLDDPLFYDFGCAVIDKRGKVYKTLDFVNRDIFKGCKDIMQSAYYKEKLPQYWEEVWNGTRTMASLYEIRTAVWALMKEYNITDVCAHNARFDCRALNTTQRYETSSRFRYFFPYGTNWIDTMLMAQDTICQQPTYRKWCQENGFTLKNGITPRKTAEVLYRYISKNKEFSERHTGLSDVMIEKEIFAHCYRQHKKMRKYLWTPIVKEEE